MSKLVRLENISKKYGSGENEVVALDKIDLSFGQGEYSAVMGPSGSGKSTLLSILGAMNMPTTGQMLVDDIDVYNLSSERQADFRREYLGFIFQNLQLIPYLTAVENVMLPLVVTKTGNHEAKATEVLKRLGLDGKFNRLPSEMSGGEQGRVAIARAVVNEPPILLADEPTGSLDTATGEEILSLFAELHREGQTIVMVTHNPESIAGAERLVQLRDGRVVEDKNLNVTGYQARKNVGLGQEK